MKLKLENGAPAAEQKCSEALSRLRRGHA